jgi:aspartyl-tRNA(Asn)/glutamyl-tRNA(Gln) amidotransferase subunit A
MSSSGAGAAVAAGLGVVAIGTDTGGSVRIPAYLCGVSGLKPTTGRVSTEGVIPLSWTLDSVGPLARRVSDVAAVMAVCAGPSLTETIMSKTTEPYFPYHLDAPVRGWRVGVPRGKLFEQLQTSVAEAFERTLQLLRDLGCELIDFDPTGIEVMNELTVLITRAEAACYHERYRQREHLYGANFLKERILAGRELKALTYLAARQQQIELQQEWLERTKPFEVLIMPSGPTVAPAHGVEVIQIGGEVFPYRPVLSRFTRPINLLGWPALTVPNGVDDEGLPTGVQIVGLPDREVRLFILGHQVEQALGWVAKLGIEVRHSS